MKRLIVLLLILLPLSAGAAIDTYEFKDEETRQRFRQLTFELRCPKCQNQNLQDSNSPIAADLRDEVYKMLQAGNNNDEIVDFMVARYGEFVLYKPPVNQMTYVLWYGPFVLVVIGIGVILLLSRKRKKQPQEEGSEAQSDPEVSLNTDEAERLKKILGEGKDK